jgi:hypothetical protein
MSASPVQPAVRGDSATLQLLSMDPEFALLLACCRGFSPVDREGLIRTLAERPLDWPRFASAAEHHGVIPQVGEILCADHRVLPADGYRVIRQLYDSNARRALWLSGELIRVIEHLESQKIPALPYKGPALAEFLYGDVARRQFSDLDILVHARDVARTRNALAEIGFAPGTALTPREEQAFLRSGSELTFDSANGRNLLEIQWQILPRFYAVDFDMEAFFERAVTQNLAGVTIRALRPEDLLLVLCVHAAKHLWMQVSWLCDIAALARIVQFDWDSVWRQSEPLGIRRIVAVTFTLSHRLLGEVLPPGMQSDENSNALANELVPLIAGSGPFDPESTDYFRRIAATRENRGDRARFWWRLATTPSTGEWSAIRLAGPLFPLYRVVRAARLAKRLF